MNNLKTQNFVRDLHKWNYEGNLDKNLEDYCKEKNISLRKEDKFSILYELADSDIFGNLFMIGHSLEDVLSDDEVFLNLINHLINKIGSDLGGGEIEKSLISFGEKNPDLGLSLAKKMLKKSEQTIQYASHPLGGAGRSNNLKTDNLIQQLFESQDRLRRICAVRTLRIQHHNQKIKNLDFVLDILKKGAKDEDFAVKQETLTAIIDFYEQAPIFCKENMVRLSKEDQNFRFLIAKQFWIHPISNKTDMIDILQTYADDKNSQVRHNMFYALTNLVDEFPEKIMSILQVELEQGGHTYGNITYLIEKLGKNNLKKSLDSFESWLATNNQFLNLSMPRFVSILVPKEERVKIIPYIDSWLKKYPNNEDVILKSLKHILSNCYDEKNDNEFVSKLLEYLTNLVKLEKINPDLFTRSENETILKCARLIDALQHYKENLNFDRISANFETFPRLKNLLSVEWIEKKKKENNRTNLLLRILSREFPKIEKMDKIFNDTTISKSEKEKSWHQFRLSSYLHDFLFLENLETNIRKLEQYGVDVISNFRKKLKNDAQTESTISEINFITPFAGKYEFQLEPVIKKKKLDFLIEVDGQKIYVEVVNPKMFKPLELLEGVFTNIPNKAKTKILEEYRDQIYELLDTEIPVIIAIDTYGNNIHEDDVEDALSGGLQYTFLMDKKTKESKGGYWSRKNNSIHEELPDTEIISAVVLFKSEMYSDWKFHLYGKLIHNVHAKNPLIEHQVKKLEETMFI